MQLPSGASSRLPARAQRSADVVLCTASAARHGRGGRRSPSSGGRYALASSGRRAVMAPRRASPMPAWPTTMPMPREALAASARTSRRHHASSATRWAACWRSRWAPIARTASTASSSSTRSIRKTTALSAHDLGPLTPLMLLLMKPLVASFMKRRLAVARTISRWMFTPQLHRSAPAWKTHGAISGAKSQSSIPRCSIEAFGQPEGFPVQPFARRIDVPVLAFNPRSRESWSTRWRSGSARVSFASARRRPLSAARPPGGGQ